ncbi:hypothetical protein COT62_03495 [Candidatus Roizmanbacteria bacterium CG09_land_8_20_14_0_10_41_9]|uniref:Uncharacterized protein n=1 Tax=Candidatus Roizmanbacteria bacterium CG09_land_8_20_14_0_10_41_9 TaxID=1974850 RepID=A0A2H0WS72_9BACT|nr:MAG: hypothetical protein COT62_03495 [Candidatus Roizmanbacteria bacterium CG09_land_8_20_14_0_10_41_9]
MPKKTKKEKIIAAYRNKLKILHLTQPTIPDKTPPPSVSEQSGDTHFILSEQDKTTTGFFMADFKKSILLILGIIALEIILYFATINNYLKF